MADEASSLAMFEEATKDLAQIILDTAFGLQTSRLQYDAARYGYERVHGPLQKGGSADPMAELLDSMRNDKE